MRVLHGRTGGLAVAIVISLSCGGGSSTPSNPTPSPSPTATAPSPPPTTPPSAPPVGGASCPFGMGDPDTFCVRKSAALLGSVDTAIDQVVQQHPDWFNQNDISGPGGYKLLKDPASYHQAVVANLQGAGMCAETDNTSLSVRNGTAFSEDYDILLATGFVRRGEGSYRQTCTPPSFPLDLSQVISYLRVAFYSIRCPDGVTIPKNGDGTIPAGCTGFVTATAKTKDNLDVNPALVGTEIDWTVNQDGEFVRVSDFPDVPFNKIVFGATPGVYSLCAQVKTFNGCLFGEVIEQTPAAPVR
jgi:hypothetical protein